VRKQLYDQARSISPGVPFSRWCEICGKYKRAKDHDADKCSKIKQKMWGKQSENPRTHC
jgi:hypothetical protein